MPNSKPYTPVPVDAAKQIADAYSKQMVVILCYDRDHQVTHTTTYGVDTFEKEQSAAAGEICTRALGGDLSRKIEFEDFHKDYSPGRLRYALDVLQAVDHASSLLAVREGITDEQLAAVQTEVRGVLNFEGGHGC